MKQLQLTYSITILFFLLIHTFPLFSQTDRPSNNKDAVLTFKDGSILGVRLNDYRLLEFGVIDLYDNDSDINPMSVSSIAINGKTYFIRQYENPEWSVKQSNIVVVELIVDGKLKLFATAGLSSQRHLFIEKDSLFQQLKVIKKDVRHGFVLVPEYKAVLVNLVSDCENFKPSMVNLTLSLVDLKNFVENYNATCAFSQVSTSGTLDPQGAPPQLPSASSQLKDRIRIKVNGMAGYALGEAKIFHHYSENNQSSGEFIQNSFNRPFVGSSVNVLNLLRWLRLTGIVTLEPIRASSKAEPFSSIRTYQSQIEYNVWSFRHQWLAEVRLLQIKKFGLFAGVGGNIRLLSNKSTEHLIIRSKFGDKQVVEEWKRPYDHGIRSTWQYSIGASVAYLGYDLNFQLGYRPALMQSVERDSKRETRISLSYTIFDSGAR